MPNAAASSASLFGREYIAQHDGQFGVDIPRQYDGTNLDRVSQVRAGRGSGDGGGYDRQYFGDFADVRTW